MCIEDLRKDIDEIDEQLVILLDRRFKLCSEIGMKKKELNISIESGSRENEIVEKIKKSPCAYLNQIVGVFKNIFHESKNIQSEIK